MILVTGATGTIGSQVVKLLREKGVELRAFVRDPNKASSIRGPGVDIVQGDMGTPATLDAAMKGIDKVFLLSVGDPRQVELQGDVINAAKRAGAEHIVKLSAQGASPDSPVSLARWHYETEKQLENSGLAYTHLRPTFFMQNFLGYVSTIKADGAFYVPMHETKLNMVDARDIAAVAVATLTEQGHAGKAYEITGPEALSFAEAADKLAAAIGKPVRHVYVSPDAARNSMLASGMPRWLVDDLLKLFELFDAGLATAVTSTVAEVARRQPHTFDQFARDYASFFKD